MALFLCKTSRHVLAAEGVLHLEGLVVHPHREGYMLILGMSLPFLPSETQHNYPGDYVMPDL